MTEDIIRLDAATMGAAIAAGELSSVQATQACLDQIAATCRKAWYRSSVAAI